MLTQEQLKELFYYHPESGDFVRLTRPASKSLVGHLVGTKVGHGYFKISINYRGYYAHRLAWLYVHGVFPPADTDHINGDRGDNRIKNLRAATRRENTHNSKARSDNAAGYKGVSRHRPTGKWRAVIHDNGKQVSLGLFPSPQAASQAYRNAASELHGEFLYTGETLEDRDTRFKPQE